MGHPLEGWPISNQHTGRAELPAPYFLFFPLAFVGAGL